MLIRFNKKRIEGDKRAWMGFNRASCLKSLMGFHGTEPSLRRFKVYLSIKISVA